MYYLLIAKSLEIWLSTLVQMMRNDLIERDADGKLSTWLSISNLYKDYIAMSLSEDELVEDDSELLPAYEKIANVWTTTSCTVSNGIMISI